MTERIKPVDVPEAWKRCEITGLTGVLKQVGISGISICANCGVNVNVSPDETSMTLKLPEHLTEPFPPFADTLTMIQALEPTAEIVFY